MDLQTYMDCYAAVHRHCSSYPRLPMIRGVTSNLSGADLYSRLASFAKELSEDAQATAQKVPRDRLLDFYNERWNRFVFSSKAGHHLLRYLNRHWVTRELNEGRKNVFFVVDLFLREWRVSLLDSMEEQLSALLLDLMQQQRNGEYVQQLPRKDFMRSVSKSFHHAISSYLILRTWMPTHIKVSDSGLLLGY